VASQATLSSYRSNGVEYKAWLTVGDANVCEDCQTNEDEGPIPIDQEFPSGDDAPPQHPDCRCNVTSVVSPDTALEGDFTAKYDDSEARDDHGRWTADGGAAEPKVFVDQNTVPRQTKLGPVDFQESGDVLGRSITRPTVRSL